MSLSGLIFVGFLLIFTFGILHGANDLLLIDKLIYKKEYGYQIEDFESVNGIICVGKFTKDEVKLFNTASENLVFVDSTPDESKFDSIVLDFTLAVKSVLNLLIDKGYKKIGYIGGIEYLSQNIRLGERRELVFRDYLYQKNIRTSTVFVEKRRGFNKCNCICYSALFFTPSI